MNGTQTPTPNTAPSLSDPSQSKNFAAIIEDADITLVLPILCLFAMELVAAFLTMRLQRNEKEEMAKGKFASDNDDDDVNSSSSLRFCRATTCYTRRMWRKGFQVTGTLFPGIALLVLAIGSSIEHASTDSVMKYTQVGLLMIVLGMMGLQTSGQSINALDLSSEHASLIYGIGLSLGTIGAILGTHGMGWLMQVTTSNAINQSFDPAAVRPAGWWLVHSSPHQAWHIAFLILAILLFLAAIVYLIFGSVDPITLSKEDEEERVEVRRRKEEEKRKAAHVGVGDRKSNANGHNSNNSGQFNSSSTFSSLHNSLADSVNWFRSFGSNASDVIDGCKGKESETDVELLETVRKRNYGRTTSTTTTTDVGDEHSKDSNSKHESESHDDSSHETELKPLGSDWRQNGVKSYGTYTIGDRVRNKLANTFSYT
jgi:hypothetical protein